MIGVRPHVDGVLLSVGTVEVLLRSKALQASLRELAELRDAAENSCVCYRCEGKDNPGTCGCGWGMCAACVCICRAFADVLVALDARVSELEKNP